MLSVRNGVASALGVSEDAADTREVAASGCFMAIRDTDMMEDEDLLLACKRIQDPGVVLQKFVAFLEEAVASDDSDSDGGED